MVLCRFGPELCRQPENGGKLISPAFCFSGNKETRAPKGVRVFCFFS